jgi:hypothetical protein
MKTFNDPDNKELGIASLAYVIQNFGDDQSGVGYEVVQTNNGIELFWNRAEAEPTDTQLEAALYTWNWDYVRKQRNTLLAETDFYALSDVTMSADMATYREALRDLPASTADSEDVVWPTKP